MDTEHIIVAEDVEDDDSDYDDSDSVQLDDGPSVSAAYPKGVKTLRLYNDEDICDDSDDLSSNDRYHKL
jgi:hypothetical protein